MLRDALEDLNNPGNPPRSGFDLVQASITFCGYPLSQIGLEEVHRCLRRDYQVSGNLEVFECERSAFAYWQVVADGTLIAELVAVPEGAFQSTLLSMPTAAEPVLVKAAKILSRAEFNAFKSRGGLVSLVYGNLDISAIVKALRYCSQRHGIETSFSGRYATLELDSITFREPGSLRSLSTFHQCYRAAPKKYQFLEVYRSLEAHFLYHILKKFNTDFFSNPRSSVSAAADALSSEIDQFAELSLSAQTEFDGVFDTLTLIKNANSFAREIHKKVSQRGGLNSKAKKGACAVYYIRCAIVHAGDRDLIFENYPDGDALLDAILLNTELASLRISGLTLS